MLENKIYNPLDRFLIPSAACGEIAYYVVVYIMGHITRLARPSVRPFVCPSVCPVWARNSKTRKRRKIKKMYKRSSGHELVGCQFLVEKIKVNVTGRQKPQETVTVFTFHAVL